MSSSSSSGLVQGRERNRNANIQVETASTCLTCTPCCCGMPARTGVLLLAICACILDTVYICHIGISLFQNFFGSGAGGKGASAKVDNNRMKINMDELIPFPKSAENRSDQEVAYSLMFYMAIAIFAVIDLGMSVSLIIGAGWEKPQLLASWVKYCFILLFLVLAYFVFHISGDHQTYNSHFWICLGIISGYTYLLVLTLCLRRDVAIKRALARSGLEIPLPRTYRMGTGRVEQDPNPRTDSGGNSNYASRRADTDADNNNINNNNVVISVPRSDFAGLIKTPDYSKTPRIRVPY